MKYRLQIQDKICEAQVDPGQDLTRVTLGEDAYELDFTSIAPGRLLLNVNGTQVQAFVAPAQGGKQVFVNGQTFLVSDADQSPRKGSKRGMSEGPSLVTPPMPSVVVRILVEVGDKVTKGQSLVVVSAMKMEATLSAPYDGRVAAINTAVDAKAAPGDILVDIEEEKADE